jgi:hypothetical protein
MASRTIVRRKRSEPALVVIPLVAPRALAGSLSQLAVWRAKQGGEDHITAAQFLFPADEGALIHLRDCISGFKIRGASGKLTFMAVP